MTTARTEKQRAGWFTARTECYRFLADFFFAAFFLAAFFFEPFVFLADFVFFFGFGISVPNVSCLFSSPLLIVASFRVGPRYRSGSRATRSHRVA